MTNGNQLSRKEQAWLVEYQACQTHNNRIASQYWAIVGAFIGFTTAFLAVLMTSNTPWLSLALGVAAIFIVYVLWRLLLRRINTIIFSNNFRMREIEQELGMLKNRTTRWLDGDEEVPNEYKARMNRLRGELGCRYEGPARRIVCWLFVPVFLLWVFFILAAFLPCI
ncbi:MAG: hypothetical protein ACE5LA_05515 [Dehalococcoidales bacterium]